MSNWEVQSETQAPQASQPAAQPATQPAAPPATSQPSWEVAGEKPAPDYLSKTEDAIQSGVTHAGNIGENFLKSAENTSAGIADLANKAGHAMGMDKAAAYLLGGKPAAAMVPTNTNDQGIEAMKAQSNSLVGTTADKLLGVGAEQVAEFMLVSELGGAAWEGMSSVERLGKVAQMAKNLESHPTMLRIAKDSMIAAGQSFVKNSQAPMGERVKTAAEAGGTMAVFGSTTAAVSGATSAVAGKVGGFLEKLGVNGETIDRAKKLADQNVRTPQEVSSVLSNTLDSVATKMHTTFDTALSGLKEKMGTAPVAISETPLYQAALDLKNVNSNLPSELRGALKAVTPASSQLDQLVNYITSSKGVEAGISSDTLIDLRQGLSRALRTAEPANIQSISHLLEGIDNTLDGLNTGASGEYAAARAAYRQTLNDLKEPFIKAIRNEKTSDVLQNITTGTNAPYKIKVLSRLVGDDTVAGYGVNKFADVVKSALDETNHLDLNKVVKGWQGIKQQTRDAIFASTPEVGKQLDMLVNGMKSLTNQMKVIKLGGVALGAAGALGLTNVANTGGKLASTVELLAGLGAAFGGRFGSRALAEDIITNPKVLSGLGKLSGYSANWLSAASATAGIRSKIASGVKGGIVSHIFNPETQKVEPAPLAEQPGPSNWETIPTEKPVQTMGTGETGETGETQKFGELPAEKLVPAMASFEGGKANNLNVRLNNPINLLFKNQPGATPYRVGDKVFANFATPETGRQAAIKQLRLDQSRPEYANMSLEDYINQKHSPDSDNYVGQARVYAKHVLSQLASAQQSQ
jgi:hypothetical protein